MKVEHERVSFVTRQFKTIPEVQRTWGCLYVRLLISAKQKGHLNSEGNLEVIWISWRPARLSLRRTLSMLHTHTHTCTHRQTTFPSPFYHLVHTKTEHGWTLIWVSSVCICAAELAQSPLSPSCFSWHLSKNTPLHFSSWTPTLQSPSHALSLSLFLPLLSFLFSHVCWSQLLRAMGWILAQRQAFPISNSNVCYSDVLFFLVYKWLDKVKLEHILGYFSQVCADASLTFPVCQYSFDYSMWTRFFPFSDCFLWHSSKASW